MLLSKCVCPACWTAEQALLQEQMLVVLRVMLLYELTIWAVLARLASLAMNTTPFKYLT
jgi:hypothetical protein